jgi:hypothetical protein
VGLNNDFSEGSLKPGVSVLVESAKAARQRVGSFVLKPLPVVHLDAGAAMTLEYGASGSSRK